MDATRMHQGRFRPAPSVRRLRLGGRSLVFSERAQQLFELNATADAIWAALARGAPPEAAMRALERRGVSAAQARAFVEAQLGAWLNDGVWTPADASTRARRRLRRSIGGLRLECASADAWAIRRLRALFSAFRPFVGKAESRMVIRRGGSQFHIFMDEAYAGAADTEQLAPRVKALVTDRVVRREGGGFFAHGALLERRDFAVMLSGRPGAGKSTLALALGARRMTLAADDVVRVDEDGRLHGVPFAPAVKAGAWPLLARRVRGLARQPIELRSDGQQVRYACGAVRRGKGRPLRLFLALDRRPEGPTRAEPLEPVEALAQFLADGFCAEGRMTGELLDRLVAQFSKVQCRRLVYSDLDEAVRAVERICDGL